MGKNICMQCVLASVHVHAMEEGGGLKFYHFCAYILIEWPS